ncbi:MULTISPECIES: hypothetical protein [Clostridium]|uniref:hypothetical protein n=1 Tax=Clostridium TaxID=1485 RepID=UPI00069DDB38|nr:MULTISPECIES: hypothetical protein [Clostridium]KOF57877.1 hypothetical protein AGR56_16920 [Clostridium sp. DMHC 10]MCD2348345.1 hypothetical protein [Clostridium guangxiense]
MYIIQTKQDLNILEKSKVMEEEFIKLLKDKFNSLYEDLSEGTPLNEFSLEDKGYIVILHEGDNIRNLSTVGLNPNGGLLSAIPEFINEMILNKFKIYEVIVVYNNEFCMTFYMSDKLINDDEVKKWIEEYK